MALVSRRRSTSETSQGLPETCLFPNTFSSSGEAELSRGNASISPLRARSVLPCEKTSVENPYQHLLELFSGKLETFTDRLQRIEIAIKPLHDTTHRIEEKILSGQGGEACDSRLASADLAPLCESISRLETMNCDVFHLTKSVLDTLLALEQKSQQPSLGAAPLAQQTPLSSDKVYDDERCPTETKDVFRCSPGVLDVSHLQGLERNNGQAIDPEEVKCDFAHSAASIDLLEVDRRLSQEEAREFDSEKSGGMEALTRDVEGTEFVEVVRAMMVKQDMHTLGGTPGSRRLIRALLRKMLHSAIWWGEIREPRRTGVINNIINSSLFETVTMSAIVVNCVFVAFGADWAMKNLGKKPPFFTGAMEMGFVLFYLLELLLKLWVHRLYFFVNKEMKWNWLDFVLVLTSFIDLFVFWIVHGGSDEASNDNVVFIRIFRLMKLAKIFRAFRAMRFVKELVVIMESLTQSMIALFWVFVMLTFMLCVFALVILQGMVEFLTEDTSRIATPLGQSIVENFGSMLKSMLTLYMAVTGGDDWGKFYTIVEEAGIFYAGMFLFFTFFFTFALFNMLTGIFVEKTVTAATPDRADMALLERRKARREALEFKHVCKILDREGRGVVTWGDFQKYMHDETMAAYMGSIGLEIHDVEMFFHMVAGSTTNGEIAIDRFVNGCMVLKGHATAIDMQQQLFETHALRNQMADFAKASNEQLQDIRNLMELHVWKSAPIASETCL